MIHTFVKQILGKALRVDHVNDYKPPKDHDDMDEETRQLHSEGCAPKVQLPPERIKREETKSSSGSGGGGSGDIVGGIRLPPRLPIDNIKQEKNIPKKVRHTVFIKSL